MASRRRRVRRPDGTKAPTAGTSRSSTARSSRSPIATPSTPGSWPGFGNALLLTGDQAYVDTLRKQMDNLYAQKKVENGRTLLPQMYGDPRGTRHTGRRKWYHWTPNLITDRLTEIYLWSMDRKDLERVPAEGLDRISRRQERRLSREGAASGFRAYPVRQNRRDARRSDHGGHTPGGLAHGP